MTDETATRALAEIATRALSRIDTHEAVCAERWKSCNNTMGEIKRHLWFATALTITTLLGAVGFLFAMVLK